MLTRRFPGLANKAARPLLLRDLRAPGAYKRWVAVASSGGGAAASAIGLHNGQITESNATNAATFHLKTLAGNDPSGGDPVTAIFPDGSSLSITAALSVTIPSGATMGFASGVPGRIWIALASDAGTPRLVVRNCTAATGVAGFDPAGILTSTTIGTGADSAQVNYSDSGVTAKPYIIAAFATYESGLTTAGTWDASPTSIVQFGPGARKPGDVVQKVVFTNTVTATTSNASYVSTGFSASITPMSAANPLEIFTNGPGYSQSGAGASNANFKLSRGTTNNTNMIGSVATQQAPAGLISYVQVFCYAIDRPNTTSAQAYAQQFLNNNSGTTGFGNNNLVTMVLTEIMG